MPNRPRPRRRRSSASSSRWSRSWGGRRCSSACATRWSTRARGGSPTPTPGTRTRFWWIAAPARRRASRRRGHRSAPRQLPATTGCCAGSRVRAWFASSPMAWPKRKPTASAGTASAKPGCWGTSLGSPPARPATSSRPSTPTSLASPAVLRPPTIAPSSSSRCESTAATRAALLERPEAAQQDRRRPRSHAGGRRRRDRRGEGEPHRAAARPRAAGHRDREGSAAGRRTRNAEGGTRNTAIDHRARRRAAARLACTRRYRLCRSAFRLPRSALQDRRQHPLRHHLAADRQGPHPAPAGAHRVSGAAGGRRATGGPARLEGLRSAQRRRAGDVSGGAAVPREARRVSSCAQGRERAGAADAPAGPARLRRAARRVPRVRHRLLYAPPQAAPQRRHGCDRAAGRRRARGTGAARPRSGGTAGDTAPRGVRTALALEGVIVKLFTICGRFPGAQCDGSRWNGLVVRDVRHIVGDLKKEPTDIAIVVTPADAAQDVTDQLVQGGVKAILNFAPIRLAVPADVVVKSVNMALELETLSFALANR